MTQSLTDTKAKIEKLLALAARAATDGERDAATAKAESLMLKWGIDAAELESRGEVKPESIKQVRRDYGGDYSLAWAEFVANVAHGFGNIKVLQSSSGTNSYRKHMYLIGHESDVDMVCTLLDSLEKQAKRASLKYRKDDPAYRYATAWEQIQWVREFIAAFGRRVGIRLASERREIAAEATPGAALVLASKEQRIAAWTAAQYGTLGTSRGGMRRTAYGRAAGDAAGRDARIGADPAELTK